MTFVSINKDWRIEVCRDTFALQFCSVVEDEDSKNYGQEYWRPAGYYSTVGGALLAIVRTEAAKPDVIVSMREMIEMYRQLAVQFDQPWIRQTCESALRELTERTATTKPKPPPPPPSVPPSLPSTQKKMRKPKKAS